MGLGKPPPPPLKKIASKRKQKEIYKKCPLRFATTDVYHYFLSFNTALPDLQACYYGDSGEKLSETGLMDSLFVFVIF